MKQPLLLVFGTVLTLVSLAGCQMLNSDDFTSSDARDLGDTFNREANAATVGMSLADTVLVIGDSAPTARVQDTFATAHTQALPAGCRTIVAGSETDSDGDGVPDDVTYQFNAVSCTRNLLFNRTRTLSGQVRLEDATPSVKDGSYRETSSNFTFSEERNGNPTFSEIRNGTRSLVLLNAQNLTRDNNITLRLNRPVLPDLRLVNQMRFAFTATTGSIALNQALPAGTLEISGGFQWARGSAPLRGFTVTTVAALKYDPACAEQRLTGGEVVLRYARGAVRVVFQPCGSEPVASLEP